MTSDSIVTLIAGIAGILSFIFTLAKVAHQISKFFTDLSESTSQTLKTLEISLDKFITSTDKRLTAIEKLLDKN